MDLNNLSKYTQVDIEKQRIIERILEEEIKSSMHLKVLYSKGHDPMAEEMAYDAMPADFEEDACIEAEYLDVPQTKFCPECGRKFSESENFCLDCGVALKKIRDINVKDIDINPQFNVKKKNTYNDFSEILTEDNLKKVAERGFDIKKITRNIRISALKTLDSAIKDNDILLDDLSILEKIILFARAFVNLEYKSYGPELGFYEFNKISIDDRQLDALQITTIMHEISHFLTKEMLTQILCELLDCSKTAEIESIATFMLTYSPVNQLIDEYAAHTVEGRFTLFGYQDYSSFLNIQKTIDMPNEEIEMLKTIGNSFANLIKDILESFIDYNLLNDIKIQFKNDILDRPDYKNLSLENCKLLNDEGLIQAFKLIIVDGFAVAMDNIENLEKINENW